MVKSWFILRALGLALMVAVSGFGAELDPLVEVAVQRVPLPQVPEHWSPDPLDHAGRPDDRLQRQPDGRWQIGPMLTHGRRWLIELPRDGDDPRRPALVFGTADRVPVTVQRFFRRLAIGPLRTSDLGPDGRDREWLWILIRQGQVHLRYQEGAPRFFDDELSVDLAIDEPDLTLLDDEHLAAWREAWWRREAGMWERAATGE